MKNKLSLFIISCCLLAISAFTLHRAGNKQTITHPKDNRPNIVIIMADDLDSRQLSCYGGKNLVTTNIDKLATEGMLFKQLICSEAICVPTRASLFTGLYPMHHGSYQNHKQVYTDRNLQSVCQYLGANGYRVGLTGKDHSTNPRSVFPFDIIKGFEPNCVAATDDYFLDSVKAYITRKDKPYCLFVMSINPHTPWTVGDPAEFDPGKLVLPPNWVDTKETRNTFQKYLAEVRRLDNQVGDIMQLLRETGQDKNTLFIFLGEQGPQFPGGKWNIYDNGQQSSMIARLPGKIKAGSMVNAIVQYEDITPTLVDFVGGKSIPNLDGQSFLPVLYGERNNLRPFAYGVHNNIPEGNAYAMRSIRDDKYKLIMNLSAPSKYYNKFMMDPDNKKSVWMSWVAQADSNEHAKFLVNRIENRPAMEFYDIIADPFELNNLATNPTFKTRIDTYAAELKKWMEAQGDAGAEVDKPFTNK